MARITLHLTNDPSTRLARRQRLERIVRRACRRAACECTNARRVSRPSNSGTVSTA